MSRGDVRWLELPEEGRRPVCVLTREQALPVLRNVLVAPITRTVRDIPTEVRLDETDGMPQACAVGLDNVRVVPRALLAERVTALSGARMYEICHALGLATGCT